MPLFDTLTRKYAAEGGSVPAVARATLSPGRVAGAIGAGRVLLGAGFLLAPTVSVRVLGVDSGTAKRMRFLARMTAARDIGIGVGTLAAGPGGDAAPWLLAGALADLTDGVVIAAAMRSGVTRGVAAAGIAAGALATGAISVWAARRLVG
ncbi:MAG TPA: hypothetical protein VIG48_08205 [Jatrophihabitans sp.]